MRKIAVLLIAAAAYVALLHYEAGIAMDQTRQLQKLYTSTDAPDNLLAASNR